MNNNLRVSDYFLAKLSGFNTETMFTSKYKSVEQVKGREDNITLIEGYVSNLPNISIKNDFGSDLLGQAAAGMFGGSSAMASGFAMFANSKGVVPQVSYSKKLAYRGVTMDDITVEFNLFLEDDVVKDIFKPITDLLYNALPLRFGNDNLNARNVSKVIGKEMNDMAQRDLNEAEQADQENRNGDAAVSSLKAAGNGLVGAISNGANNIVDFTTKLVPALDAVLKDAQFLATPHQMSMDIFLYMGYSKTSNATMRSEYKRAASFITGPWLIQSVTVELGELVIHPGLPDRAKVVVGLTPSRTGDGEFIRDVFMLDSTQER